MSITKPATPAQVNLMKEILAEKECSLKAARGFRPLMVPRGLMGYASKQRRTSTTASGGKSDNKAHQQNAGAG